MSGAGWAFRAAGALLLIVPFLPLGRLFDDPPGTTWLVGPYEWLLGLFIFGTVAWLLARTAPDPLERWAGAAARVFEETSPARFRLVALLLLALLLLAASTFAFSRTPLLIDSIIQLFQGKIFASGAVWAPAPRHEAFFTTQHMLMDGGRWYAQYPPGHPAVLALGVWLGAPWLVPIALSLLTAWLIADVARRLFGETVARVTLLLAVLAPFFWFMGASFMNHVTTLAFIALALWCFVRWAVAGGMAGGSPAGTDVEGGRGEARRSHAAGGSPTPRAAPDGPGSLLWIGLTGVALGAAFLARPLTAAAVGAGLAIPALRMAGRRWWAAGLAGGLGVVALASLYFLYNAATTGDPLTPGYLKLWGADHGMGFHATPWGDAHTPLTGLRNQLIDLGLLHAFLFEWPIPALLPLGLVLAAGWMRGSWEGRLLLAFFAIPAAYFFYWHRDAFLGPRYLYEGLPFLLPLVALAFVRLRRRLRGRMLGDLDLGTFALALVALSFVYALGYGIPQRFRVYATGLESVKRDLVAEAEAAGLSEGLVFVKVSWGNRLIARARGAGATASVAERVYRSSDHCEMELVVGAAEERGWSAGRLNDELLAIQRPEEEIEVVRLNEDPTLRLVPGRPLAPACAREVLYDRDGRETMPDPPSYTNFSPHLARNAPDLSGPFVFARDLRERNARLRAEYPELPAYLYRGGAFEPLP